MITIDTGFDAEEHADRRTWTVYIATWTALRGQPFAVHLRAAAGSYGAVVAGRGAPTEPLWGATLTTLDDVSRGCAILHVARKAPDDIALRVHTRGMVQTLRDAAAAIPRGGLKADNKTPLDGYDIFKAVLDLRDRISIQPIPPRFDGRAFQRAYDTARGIAMQASKECGPLHAHQDLNTVILDSDGPELPNLGQRDWQ